MHQNPQSRNSRASTLSAGRVSVATKNVSEESISEPESIPRTAFSWSNMFAVVPVLLAVGTSINTLWNHFAADDLEQILNNSFIKTFSNLPAAFTKSVWSFMAADIVFSVDPYFRPLFSTLFTINYALFGNKPFGWHLISILTHGAVTFMVFLVTRELTERNWTAGLIALNSPDERPSGGIEFSSRMND